jgi:hypothetical protein
LSVKHDCSQQASNVDKNDLEAVMGQCWRQVQSPNGEGGKELDNTEIVLATFDGHCFACEKKGHMAGKCTEKKSGARLQKAQWKCIKAKDNLL